MDYDLSTLVRNFQPLDGRLHQKCDSNGIYKGFLPQDNDTTVLRRIHSHQVAQILA